MHLHHSCSTAKAVFLEPCLPQNCGQSILIFNTSGIMFQSKKKKTEHRPRPWICFLTLVRDREELFLRMKVQPMIQDGVYQ